jgi:hypothetical protein
MKVRGGEICKPLHGAAKQRPGTTFTQAIKACPGCLFAALDTLTGLIVTSDSEAIREVAIRKIRKARYSTAIWQAPDGDQMTANTEFNHWQNGHFAINDLRATTWKGDFWTARMGDALGLLNDMQRAAVQFALYWHTPEFERLYSYGEDFTVAERLNSYLAREPDLFCRDAPSGSVDGFWLWFAGEGTLDVRRYYSPSPLPLLCGFCLSAAVGNESQAGTVADFRLWLLTVRTEKTMIAIAADKEGLATQLKGSLSTLLTAGDAVRSGNEFNAGNYYWSGRLTQWRVNAWVNSLGAGEWFESGQGPSWMNDKNPQARTVLAVPQPEYWTDEDGEPITYIGEYTGATIGYAIDNA